MNLSRVRKLNNHPDTSGRVVYWMSRDQRSEDNWALLYAAGLAKKYKSELKVVFCLVPEFLGATWRQYGFMLRGLVGVGEDLGKKGISFELILGDPKEEIPKYINKHKATSLISDFSPLRINRQWKDAVSKNINIPHYEVDAHNIVPTWIASNKKEIGARTLRPKIKKLLDIYLEAYPKLPKFGSPIKNKGIDIEKIRKYLKIDFEVEEVDWLRPGEKEAKKNLDRFISYRLNDYFAKRNDPGEGGQSNLSAYLHFGQISALRVALEASKSKVKKESKEAFLEELIIRRELSDNFCLYEDNYDNEKCFPQWAINSLSEHQKDSREYLYSKKDLENAGTHDPLWNAAQKEMVKQGKMHGYMRMYWAKKILEWTKSPKEAVAIAIYLNDKYELDGRDPNGYAGIAWSLGGVHDRAWFPRPIFGLVRYMSYNGAKAKFDIERYIKKVDSL